MYTYIQSFADIRLFLYNLLTILDENETVKVIQSNEKTGHHKKEGAA
jgi:hypothetical protein